MLFGFRAVSLKFFIIISLEGENYEKMDPESQQDKLVTAREILSRRVKEGKNDMNFLFVFFNGNFLFSIFFW